MTQEPTSFNNIDLNQKLNEMIDQWSSGTLFVGFPKEIIINLDNTPIISSFYKASKIPNGKIKLLFPSEPWQQGRFPKLFNAISIYNHLLEVKISGTDGIKRAEVYVSTPTHTFYKPDLYQLEWYSKQTSDPLAQSYQSLFNQIWDEANASTGLRTLGL